MKTLDLEQGSPAWLAARASYHCASEAPVMMGASKRLKRSELLRLKATGSEQEFSDWVRENLLEKGHEVEALALPLVEEIIGEVLYPVVGCTEDDQMLASFDGLDMAETTGFEHKMWNEEVAAAIRAGATEFPNGEEWQLEHQLLVGDTLERVIFVCSDGTRERLVWMEYRRVPGRAETLVAHWKQFDEDVANYQHVEVLPPAVGKSLTALPALAIELVGEVKSSNLALYRESATQVIAAVNTNLQTDQDFADAESFIKFSAGAEERITLVKQQALEQTKSIAELFDTCDEIHESFRQKRLQLEKLVKVRKETIRDEIRTGGLARFAEHIKALEQRIGQPYMPAVHADFAGVMKGKKTLASLRDAVDTELARAKIAANEIADRIDLNLKKLAELAPEHGFLFPDLRLVCTKAADDFVALVKLRVADHEEATRREAQQRADAAARALAPVVPASAPSAPPARRLGGAPPPPPKRPRDVEIIQVLASHYNVPTARVVSWLRTLDLPAVAA